MISKLTVLVLAGLLAGGLSGCVINVDASGDDQHGMMSGSETMPAPFDMNDIMFAQMMIPHHEQAVELATLAETRSHNPAILDLAARIKNAQQPEIDLMNTWITSTESGMEMSHNMTMPGIVSDDDMAIIRSAQGTEFDQLFLEHMVAHHEGAIIMARNVLSTTSNADVTTLAQNIVNSQTAEISEMKNLLKK